MEKSKKLVSLRRLKGTDVNPFIQNLKGKMYLQPRANTIVAKGQEIIDTTTGEIVQDSVLMGRRRIVDKSQFAKIYASEMGVLFDLSKPAVNVFMYLAKVMDYDQKAIFDYNREYERVGYKSNVPPLKGIRELIEKGIIYPHSLDGLWWMNPTIVCKGERFAVYTEYVTSEQHQRDQLEVRLKAEARLREQGRDVIQSLDEHTRMQIDSMNKAEEAKEKRLATYDMFSGEEIPLSTEDIKWE